MENTTHQAPRFLRRQDVEHMTGLSRSSIYSLAKEGRFPKQYRITAGTSAWLESEVEAWMEARIAEQQGGEA